jgi:hypothetical protein
MRAPLTDAYRTRDRRARTPNALLRRPTIPEAASLSWAGRE